MKEYYRDAILEAVDVCEDISLLDLVWKMLLDGAGAPGPAELIALEVRNDANDPRDQGRHGAVPVQICSRAAHPHKDHSKLGNRWAELPGVCSGADCLQSAA